MQEARLNNIVDCAAAVQHEKVGEWATRDSIAMLPQMKAQLHVHNSRYSGKVDKAVQGSSYRPQMRAFLLKKMHMEHAEHLVHWPLLHWHHSHFPYSAVPQD